MKEDLTETSIHVPVLSSEIATVPPQHEELQASSKPTQQFLTYKESCGLTKPSAMISAGALVMALEQMLRIAKESPHWSAQERKGAVAIVIDLNEHFELAMESRGPQRPIPVGALTRNLD